MSLVRFVSLLLCVAFATAQKEEGDQCLAPARGNPAWHCKVVKDCPPALKLIKERKTPPVHRRCGFKGSSPMVCCPPYEIEDWSKVDPKVPLPSGNTPTPPVNKGPSKATIMCKEYSQLIYVDDSLVPLTAGSKPTKVRRCELVVPTIVGGVDAEPKEYPHMALLGYSNPVKYQCGGSLISDKFILSAAHCEKHPRYGFVHTILLGDLNTNSETDDADPQTFKVSRRFVHPEYRQDSNYNDIMLIEMERSVTFSLYIRPLCLHTSKTITPLTAFATGWGRVEAVGPSSDHLQKIELPFVSGKQCNESFRAHIGSPQLRYGIMDETQLCAGAQKDKDSCQGDSGGPLQIPLGDCMYSQVGIVSFGRQCGTEKSPGVYTRVSAFVPWIENIVWPQN